MNKPGLTFFILLFVFYSKNAAVFGGIKITKQKMQSIILSQVNRYPEMEIQDIYKLVHQAAFGSEHAVKDTSFVRNWLDDEWNKIDSVCNEPVCDTINPLGDIVRINLRPCKFYGLNKEKILLGFIKTANNFKGSKRDFEQYWQWIGELAGKIHFTKKELTGFLAKMKKLGYPAVHHSKVYQKNYMPAYRVLMKEEIPDGFTNIK